MSYDFVKEWKERGDNAEHYVSKFFCYYIAFNWLYNTESDDSETARIKQYISNLISKESSYDPRLLLKNREWSQEIRDGRSGRVNSYLQEPVDPRIHAFLQIYQVRCNLFHGSKSMKNPRNKILVKEASDVLEDLLNRIIANEDTGDDDV